MRYFILKLIICNAALLVSLRVFESILENIVPSSQTLPADARFGVKVVITLVWVAIFGLWTKAGNAES